MKPTWGLVATVKNPEDHMLAFVAFHLALGASRIWLYFDDPDDPAFDRISRLPRVTPIRCTDWYWIKRVGRSDEVVIRQIRNALHAQRRCKLDWLGHIDIDEYLFAPRPVADILADIPNDVLAIRMEPFEAMHDPDLPDDIFTSRHFRGPLNGKHAALLPLVFGPMAYLLPKGCLSHQIGKSFCRPRARGMAIALHDVILNKIKQQTPFHHDLRMLHFHAQDPVAWRRALPFRLSGGSYFLEQSDLAGFLRAADDADLRRFYDTVLTLTPEKIAHLQAHDRLITADLGLRAKVDDLLAGRLG